MNFIKGLLITLLVLFGITCTIIANEPHKHGSNCQHTCKKKNHINFVENKGQWHKNVQYKAEIPSGYFFIEKNKFIYDFYNPSDYSKCHITKDCNKNDSEEKTNKVYDFHAVSLEFINSDTNNLSFTPQYPQLHYNNYFLGNDKSKWARKVKLYDEIIYNDLYRGIDLKVYNSNGNSIKYDFIVNRGADVKSILLKYSGHDEISINNRGELTIKTSLSDIVETRPYAYQVIDGKTKYIKCEYVLNEDYISFDFPEGYNKRHQLIIDPEVIFSSYSGSSSNNFGYTATYDSKGFLYSGSTAFGPSSLYPTTTGAYQRVWAGGVPDNGTDIAITKWDTTGQFLIYSTYLGGNGSELPHSLIVNSNDELFVFGTTGSTNFPTTTGAFDNTFNGGYYVKPWGLGVTFPVGVDMYISRLNADGSDLIASTYVGGSSNDGLNSSIFLIYNYADEARGEIFIDEQNNCYIASSTESDVDFPTTPTSFQPTYGGGTQDGCIMKFDNDLTTMIWGSYIGGSNDDAVYSVAFGENNDIYIAGGTNSADYPTTSSAFHPNYMGGRADGVVTQISNNGNTILNSTYFGSDQYDQTYFVELDNDYFPYIYGQTEANGSTLIFNADYNKPNSGMFVSKLEKNLSALEFSTVFGTGEGLVSLSPTAFLVDVCNKIYIAGWGGQTNIDSKNILNLRRGNHTYTHMLETTPDAFQSTTDGSDFYIAVLSDDANSLVYSTFYGGNLASEHVDGGTSRFDKKGIIYQACCAGCNYFDEDNNYIEKGYSDIYTTPNAHSAINESNCNLAVLKMDLDFPIVIADFEAPTVGCAPFEFEFINLSTDVKEYFWDFGDGNTSTDKNPIHTYTEAGVYEIMLVAINDISCNVSDTAYKEIRILNNTRDTLPDVITCNNNNVQIGLSPDDDSTISYAWSPSAPLSNPNISNPIAPANPTTYLLIIKTESNCTDSLYQTVDIFDIEIRIDKNSICVDDSVTFRALANDSTRVVVWSTNSSFTDTINTNLSFKHSPDVANTIYIRATSINNCISEDSLELEPYLFNPYISDSLNIVCYNDSTGFIAINDNRGISGYSFDWNTGDTTSTIINIPAATYTVTVSDNLGCSTTLSTTLTQPTEIISTQNNLSDNDCNGNCNGGVDISASGGNAPYSILWSHGATTFNVNDLCNGKYIFYITDASSCKVNGEVIIPGTTNFAATADLTHPICIDSTGSAEIETTNGTPFYNYEWFDKVMNPLPLPNNANASGLAADTFNVHVTDNNNCIAYVNIIIINPDTLKANANVVDSIKCLDACDGYAEVIASGGTPGYKYHWSRSIKDTKPALSNICTGEYTVTVFDINECYAIDTITLHNADTFFVDAMVTPASCEGVCNGRIKLFPNGGTPPYNYKWNTALISGDSAFNLCPYNYTVVVTDSNNCPAFDNDPYIIDYLPYIPFLEIIADNEKIYLGEEIELHATSGYKTYIWTPENLVYPSNTSTVVASPTKENNSYKVEISDSVGCKNNAQISFKVISGYCGTPYIYVPNAFTPNNDNENDILYVRGNGITQLYFAVYDRWGEKVFETTDINKGWDGTYKGKDCDPAVFVYYLRVICSSEETYFEKGNVTLIR